ncbi:rab-GTPase-TBC domain-containing protein [Mycotypha africana]|uniref:rab-GTPase-TBC domain-containing protein n=1 Tax=Mycotypha africana TaxID=64632 RepID=UPI002301160E|nr:rab-GTPase-TBC domain-containing protein [Mycotypha africana]KAI8968591.1 rab-GTPase-TBC domain-containing protein [Mycotypha africana]
METGAILTSPTSPSTWLDMSNAINEIEGQQSQQQLLDPPSQLTTYSSESDFTQQTLTTTSSIRTVPTRTSDSNTYVLSKVSSELKMQYDQKPESVPDIAAEMEKWFAMTDRYGFLEEKASSTSNDKHKTKEVKRSGKWAKMSTSLMLHDDHIHKFSYTSKFKKRVYKGIPDCWRREAWYFLVTDRLKDASKDHQLKTSYRELLSKSSIHERQIDLDIPRTLRDHIMFKQRYGSGQRALFNVLRAFANYDEEVGYCQGMTNIVATILMYCEEERAFLIFVHMFLRDKLHNLYKPGFPALMESFYIQDGLLKRYLPKLYHHLTSLGLSSDIYSTRWYITLFSGGVINYHTLIRIWDVYYLCGFDVFFFVAIALLRAYEARLLASDLDGCMEILGSTLSVPNDDKFMKAVESLFEKNTRNNTVNKLRQEYKSRHR